MLAIAERLATYGYFTLMPDLFYRSGPYLPMNPYVMLGEAEKRKSLAEKFFALATQANIMSDTRAFLDYLATEPGVSSGGIGTTGYCMGGLMSLTAAGTFPDRIVATASYHGGLLATETPESPHLVAPKIRSRVYVAAAVEDSLFPDDMKRRLEQALSRAGVDHRSETYQARHGWVLSDHPSYDAAGAERHWETLVGLFDGTLIR